MHSVPLLAQGPQEEDKEEGKEEGKKEEGGNSHPTLGKALLQCVVFHF